MAGTAQAADLAVAESVEYVKVCDAYGAGYFYAPGSDVAQPNYRRRPAFAYAKPRSATSTECSNV
jgi:hypothetical protein